MLHSIGLFYFAQLDMFNQLQESKNGVKSTRITSAGITAIDLNVGYLFGMPKTVSAGGLSIDVDRDLHTIQALDGDSEKVKAYNMVTGQISSYLEGGVFQQIFGGQAVSTMHILQHANMQGMKTYQINQDNADSIIPQLQYDSAKKQMFRDLINSGKEITVPEENVTIGGWTGTGYIALNPDDGTGAYMIDGGLSGGEIDFDVMPLNDWAVFWISTLLSFITSIITWFIGMVFSIATLLLTTIEDVLMYISGEINTYGFLQLLLCDIGIALWTYFVGVMSTALLFGPFMWSVFALMIVGLGVIALLTYIHSEIVNNSQQANTNYFWREIYA